MVGLGLGLGVGGECPYWGCIPSKMMIRAAGLLAEARRIPGMAGESTVTPEWTPLARRIRDEATDTGDDTVAVDLFTGKGGRFVRGLARVLGPAEVEVAGVGRFRARRALVLATGGVPVVLSRAPLEASAVPPPSARQASGYTISAA